jgi:hypothetical protein
MSRRRHARQAREVDHVHGPIPRAGLLEQLLAASQQTKRQSSPQRVVVDHPHGAACAHLAQGAPVQRGDGCGALPPSGTPENPGLNLA